MLPRSVFLVFLGVLGATAQSPAPARNDIVSSANVTVAPLPVPQNLVVTPIDPALRHHPTLEPFTKPKTIDDVFEPGPSTVFEASSTSQPPAETETTTLMITPEPITSVTESQTFSTTEQKESSPHDGDRDEKVWEFC